MIFLFKQSKDGKQSVAKLVKGFLTLVLRDLSMLHALRILHALLHKALNETRHSECRKFCSSL